MCHDDGYVDSADCGDDEGNDDIYGDYNDDDSDCNDGDDDGDYADDGRSFRKRNLTTKVSEKMISFPTCTLQINKTLTSPICRIFLPFIVPFHQFSLFQFFFEL